MSRLGALKSRAHALGITGVLTLVGFAAIVLAAGIPAGPGHPLPAAAAHSARLPSCTAIGPTALAHQEVGAGAADK